MKVLVCGATGFVGGAITRHLLSEGHEVRALSRTPDRVRQALSGLDFLSAAPGQSLLTVAQGDVTDPKTLRSAVGGVDAVVQAAQFRGAPVEDPARGLTYDKVDRGGTVNLLSAIGSASARPRFLYVSGITVHAQAREPWNQAKWAAEEAIRSSGLEWTIVRSCWAYGGGDKALNRLLGYSDYLPFVPVFGDGQALLTPVFVEDLGRVFALLLTNAKAGRDTVLRLGGPDTVTLDDFLRTALRVMGRRRSILHIPKPLARLQAGILQHLPGRLLTPDAVDFVAQGGAATQIDRSLLAEHLPDLTLTPLAQGLSGYLGTRA